MPEDGQRFSLSETLLAELRALFPGGAGGRPGRPLPDLVRPDPQTMPAGGLEEAWRRRVYTALYEHKLGALCLSGGGIRSATFALGVLQALAKADLLTSFHYLSTVSGGGYIGSFLSAWRHHAGNSTAVIDGLRSRPAPDCEAPPIAHLRRYGSYLTPRLGLLSADTWTVVAMVLRNLLIIWLILGSAIAVAVTIVKLLAALLGADAAAFPKLDIVVAAACLLLGGLSFGYKMHGIYSDGSRAGARTAQSRFVRWSVIPAVLAGAGFAWMADSGLRSPADLLAAAIGFSFRPPESLGVLWWRLVGFSAAVLVIAIVGAATVLRLREDAHPRTWPAVVWDIVSWAAGALVFATALWAGLALYDCGTAKPAVLFIFGAPWYLLATLLAQTTYVMLRSSAVYGEHEREWLGRASGWHFVIGLSWIAVTGTVWLGPVLLGDWSAVTSATISGLGTISGAATAILGKSPQTAAQRLASGKSGLVSNIALAVAGPIFAVVLVMLMSTGLDWVVLRGLLHDSGGATLCFPASGTGRYWSECGPLHWGYVAAAMAVIMLVADYFANVNRFSLHSIYRNRLIRAYLGGPRLPDRRPDGFTGFDWDDNLRLRDLRAVGGEGPAWRPLHVLGMALNLTSSRNLAWQQRQAESFVATPFHSGTAELGYRNTADYGGSGGGMTLGTAMAVSGAAISPNMGYHSSTSVAFLLTLFNVRLGWWLGNPGRAGRRTYRWDGPRFALWPLLCDLFGLTDEDSAYVNLSDGGHFEDLGLYEMVRRRCRWIVVVDADEDPARGFEDLGNAVRKIWIDLGARITFPNSPLLQADQNTAALQVPYFAVGRISYLGDGTGREGHILYIKPGLRGREGAADLTAYARSHAEFPNQSTADQWFDEPQLESYRKLGYTIFNRLLHAPTPHEMPPAADLPSLFARLDTIVPLNVG